MPFSAGLTAVRHLVREPFAFKTFEGFLSAFAVGNLAGVMAKIKLSEIAMQVLFADVMKRFIDATLEK